MPAREGSRCPPRCGEHASGGSGARTAPERPRCGRWVGEQQYVSGKWCEGPATHLNSMHTPASPCKAAQDQCRGPPGRTELHETAIIGLLSPTVPSRRGRPQRKHLRTALQAGVPPARFDQGCGRCVATEMTDAEPAATAAAPAPEQPTEQQGAPVTQEAAAPAPEQPAAPAAAQAAAAPSPEPAAAAQPGAAAAAAAAAPSPGAPASEPRLPVRAYLEQTGEHAQGLDRTSGMWRPVCWHDASLAGPRGCSDHATWHICRCGAAQPPAAHRSHSIFSCASF